MRAMEVVASNNNMSFGAMKDAVKEVTDATSLSGGQARQFFTSLANIGVTNTNELSKAMIGLQGSTVITGGSFDSVKGRMMMLINATSLQARALLGMGLSMQKVASVNGFTVDELKKKWKTFTPDQKLSILNKALAQNATLTQDLANTTGDKLKEMSNSWANLQKDIGASTSGATNRIYDLINNGINQLDDAIKNVPGLGAFAGLGLGAASVLMSIEPLMRTFNQLTTAVSNAKAVMDLLTISNIRETATNIAGRIATAARTVADGARTAAQWLLNESLIAGAVAEYAFLAPLLLIIAGAAALVGGLYVLGQHMGWWNDWSGFVQAFQNALGNAWRSMQNFGKVVSSVLSSCVGAWNGFTGRVRSLVSGLINSITGMFRSLPGRISSALSGVYNAIVGRFRPAISWVSSGVNSLRSAWNSVTHLGGLIPSSGFESNIGSSGFTTGSTLSSSISKSNNNSTVININGLVEEQAANYIVGAVNSRIQKENLIKGAL